MKGEQKSLFLYFINLRASEESHLKYVIDGEKFGFNRNDLIVNL